MEIGTAYGGTLFLFSMVSSEDAFIISVDLPSGYFRWKEPLYRSFAKSKQRISIIRADSHDSRTLDRVKGLLGDEKIEFLFIDGDHSYEGVKRDFETYSKLVCRGGVIAFHDIVPGPPETVGGVPRFWNEIKYGFKYVEIVKSWKQLGYGIEIIYA